MCRTAPLIVCALVAWPGAARAAHRVAVHGAESGCPSADSFAAELRTIFADVVIADDFGLRVELQDAGADYRVIAGGAERQFSDASRRCDERARKAAVFVALVLEPPQVDLPTVAAPAAIVAGPRRRWLAELEVGGLFDAAPRADTNSLFAGGAQARLFAGARYVGAIVAVSGESPTELELRGARARLTRVPFDAGVRARLRRGKLDLGLDGSLVLAYQSSRGLDAALGVEQSRLEVGIRLAVKAQYWAWARVAPFLALQTEIIPRPYELVLPGAGVVGTTPQYWVGTVAGVALALH
jgi:hypothetical protein